MFWTIIICKTIVKIPLNIDMVEFQKHYIQETNNICKNIKVSPSGVKACKALVPSCVLPPRRIYVLDVKAGNMRASIHELFGFRSDKI
jgi:hypothetical protein